MSPQPKQVALRLEPDELEKLDTLRSAIQLTVGYGIRVSISDVVRYCIMRTYEHEVSPLEMETANGSQSQDS